MSRLLEITEKGLADFRIVQAVNVDKRACRIGAIIPKHPETGGPMRTHRLEFSGRDEEIRRRKFHRDPFLSFFGVPFGPATINGNLTVNGNINCSGSVVDGDGNNGA